MATAEFSSSAKGKREDDVRMLKVLAWKFQGEEGSIHEYGKAKV